MLRVNIKNISVGINIHEFFVTSSTARGKMRIEIECNICSNNKSLGTSPYKRYSHLSFVNDEGIYEFICPEGHVTKTVLRTPTHEVLFNIASEALLDGYFREAITSFAASLEKFYDFAIHVIFISKSLPKQEFEKCWKIIKKQSERQLGGFALLWLAETEVSPNLLSSNLVNLRNEVIHQGKIPTYDECIKYGQGVIDVITPIELKMLNMFPEAHKEQCFSIAKSARKDSDEPLTILSIASVLQGVIHHNMSLESCLDSLRIKRERNGIKSINPKEYRVTNIFPNKSL